MYRVAMASERAEQLASHFNDRHEYPAGFIAGLTRMLLVMDGPIEDHDGQLERAAYGFAGLSGYGLEGAAQLYTRVRLDVELGANLFLAANDIRQLSEESK